MNVCPRGFNTQSTWAYLINGIWTHTTHYRYCAMLLRIDRIEKTLCHDRCKQVTSIGRGSKGKNFLPKWCHISVIAPSSLKMWSTNTIRNHLRCWALHNKPWLTYINPLLKMSSDSLALFREGLSKDLRKLAEQHLQHEYAHQSWPFAVSSHSTFIYTAITVISETPKYADLIAAE